MAHSRHSQAAAQETLARFLCEAAGKKIEYGEWDCGLWLADWYMLATGKPDPAQGLRGVGLKSTAIVWRVIRSLGLTRTKEPKPGDVGLVSIERGHLVGAIFSGRNWWMLCDDGGLGSLPPHALRFAAAWRLA